MKFKIEIGHTKGGASWWETFDEEECRDEAGIRKWAKAVVQNFNNTLRPK